MIWEPRFVLRVDGIPQPKGWLKAVSRPGSKFTQLVNGSPKTKPWQTLIEHEARALNLAVLDSPHRLDMEFRFHRPQWHFSKSLNRELVPRAPLFHAVPPDADKLARTVFDALQSIAYTNDSRVVRHSVIKLYADCDHPPGVRIAGYIPITKTRPDQPQEPTPSTRISSLPAE